MERLFLAHSTDRLRQTPIQAPMPLPLRKPHPQYSQAPIPLTFAGIRRKVRNASVTHQGPPSFVEGRIHFIRFLRRTKLRKQFLAPLCLVAGMATASAQSNYAV